MSSAACVAWNLTCGRPPKNENVRTRGVRRAGQRDRDGADRLLRACRRPGPAMPVTPTPTSPRSAPRMPSAIATRDRLADRAVRLDQLRRARRRAPSWRRCCRRRRRRARSRSCRARRSAATAAGRRCTTRRPRSSAARSRSRSPTTSSIARPSMLKTSRPERRAELGRAPRERPAGAGVRVVRPQRQVQLDLPGRRENRRLDRRRRRAPARVDRLDDLFDVRLAAPGRRRAIAR